jgi:redox-sensitive bicupin YhaK (pirin superfamily)
MWIMPRQRGLAPSVEQRQYHTDDRHNRLLRILKPEHADGEGATVHQDVSMYVSRLDGGASLEHLFAAGRGGYVYLIDGDLELNGERLTTGDAAKILDAGALRIGARATSEVILVDTPL